VAIPPVVLNIVVAYLQVRLSLPDFQPGNPFALTKVRSTCGHPTDIISNMEKQGCEISPGIESAIAREKHIKKDSRKKKQELVTGMNSEWKDLYSEL
jgi:hypothetical protein